MFNFEGFNLKDNSPENGFIEPFESSEPIMNEFYGMNSFILPSPDEKLIIQNENNSNENNKNENNNNKNETIKNENNNNEYNKNENNDNEIINNENNKNDNNKNDNYNNINNNNENNINDDYSFPFTKGEKLENIFKKIGIKANANSSEKNKNDSYLKNKLSFNYFKIIEFNEGNLKKKRKPRRMKADHIIARIKSKFHNVIKDIINKKLFKAGAKELLFEPFPQCFITNVSIKYNHDILNKRYEELLEYINIPNNKNNIKQYEYDNIKYTKNKDVLEKLNKNKEICINSEFDKIKKMKYIDLLKAYFSSKEFEESIIDLYNKKEKISYIEKYTNKALNYVDYFSNHKKCKNINESKNPGISNCINIDEGK